MEVRSGGQRGVDQAAWRVAHRFGIATGGMMARGFRTESSLGTSSEFHPEFAKRYGAREHSSIEYPPRSRWNVAHAHATLIISDREELKGGTKLTFDYAYNKGKQDGPHNRAGLFVAVLGVSTPEECADWIKECIDNVPNQNFILNVAGPRESGCPGIGERAEEFLAETFLFLGYHPIDSAAEGWDV